MKKTTIALIVALGLGSAAFAFGPGGGHHKGGMFKMVKKLDLTKEQKKELGVIKDAQEKQMKAKREEFMKNRKKIKESMRPNLSEFMTKDNFDKDAFKSYMTQKIEKKRKMMKEKMSTMLDKRAETMEKVFNVLTPEQRTKWIQLSQKR